MHAIVEESTVFLNEEPSLACPAFSPVARPEKQSPVSFLASLVVSVTILSASAFLIPFQNRTQKLEYGVDSADQSVEIDLVAAMTVEETLDIPELEPIEPIAEIAPPDQPQMVDTGDFVVPSDKIVEPQPTPERPKEIARKPVQQLAPARPLHKVVKAAGDGTSPANPGRDKTTARASRGASVAELAYLRNPEPRYPKAAQEAGQQGVTRLKISVDEGGHPVNVQLARSSGWPLLDESALNTVRDRWRFKPRPGGGIVSKVIPIRFDLAKKRRG
ncbi:MAG TPA: energy transducer TonB [Chthoniobacterales bacterium]